MSSASRPISIQATLPLPPVAEEKERVVVDLEKDTHGLGFTVAGIENTPDGVCSSSPGCLVLPYHINQQGEGSIGIFVDRIHENGLAHMDGRLKPGDQIAEVDGQTLIGKSHVACMNILRGTGKSVSIAVIRKRSPVSKGLCLLCSDPILTFYSRSRIHSTEYRQTLIRYQDAISSSRSYWANAPSNSVPKDRVAT